MTVTETPEEAQLSMLGTPERRQSLLLFVEGGWHDNPELRARAGLEHDTELNAQMIRCLVGEVIGIFDDADQMGFALKLTAETLTERIKDLEERISPRNAAEPWPETPGHRVERIDRQLQTVISEMETLVAHMRGVTESAAFSDRVEEAAR